MHGTFINPEGDVFPVRRTSPFFMEVYMPDNMKSKTKVPTAVLASWAAILDDIAKAAIIGIGVVVWSNGYGNEMKNLAIIGLTILAVALLYSSCLIRLYLSE